MNVNKSMGILAAVLMALAVGIGAFGAHGLQQLVDETAIATYKTGNFYHFIHGLGMLFVVLLYSFKQTKAIRIAFYLFLVGIILFSGSLYLLAIRELIGLPGIFGAITPIGGLFFIGGWLVLAWGFKKIDD